MTVRCLRCNRPVEPDREHFTYPTCQACYPPPPQPMTWWQASWRGINLVGEMFAPMLTAWIVIWLIIFLLARAFWL